MLHRRALCVTPLDAEIDLSNARNVREARLVHVQGCGALIKHSFELPEDRGSWGDIQILSVLTLNETPLLQMELPLCPTCAGLIAAGHGIENVHCTELEALSERINAPFVSLEQSIRDLEPLLTLLKTGLYVIADAVCVPTEGDGTFFWAAPNESARHPATCMISDPPNFDYYDGQPLYLYPSQSAARFDAARAEYYKPLITQPDAPRAIAYTVTDSLNLLLDGHHKAAAAAALRRPVPCLLILPLSGMEYRGKLDFCKKPKALIFHSVQVRADGLPNKLIKALAADMKADFTLTKQRIAPGKLVGRAWEDHFLRAGGDYPSMRELMDMLRTGLSFTDPVPEEWLRQHLEHPDREDAQRAIAGAIPILELQADPRLRAIALQIAREFPVCRARRLAYRALSRMRNDAEIEQLFVDYLVEHDDKHDALREIVNGYWDN